MCQIFAGQNPGRYESVTRRLRLNGQSTSIRLERSFWRIIDTIAENEGLSTPAFISKLHSEVLELHGEAPNFTSLLRCACTIHLGELERDATASRIAAE
jgi:predicted DNA-binding ribbon-helix-helix protein